MYLIGRAVSEGFMEPKPSMGKWIREASDCREKTEEVVSSIESAVL